jgi:histidinol-phosphate aminotransferase
VAAGIRALGLRVWPSRANFLLFAVEDGRRAHEALLAQGIRVRNVSSLPGLGHHLRVTIGTAEENTAFLEALGRALGAFPSAPDRDKY